MLLSDQIADCERHWRSDGSDPRTLRRLIGLRRRSGLPIPAELVDGLVRPLLDNDLPAEFELAIEETLTPCALWQGTESLHWQRRSRIRSFEHRALWLKLDLSLDAQPSPTEVVELLQSGLVNALSLNLDRGEADDISLWLLALQRAPELQRLELSYLPGHARLALSRLRCLTHLRIDECEEPLDELMSWLAGFPSLVTLRLGGVIAGRAFDFQQLEALPALTRLAISCFHGSRSQPIRRARLAELRDLVLEGFHLNRGGARALAAFRQLRNLEFAGSVEDIEDSLTELSELPSLRRLSVTSPALGPELSSEARGPEKLIQLATFASMRAAAYRGLRNFRIESFATEALDQRAAIELPAFEGLQRLELRGVMHEGIGAELSQCRSLKRLDLVDVYCDELVFGELTELPALRELVILGSELRGPSLGRVLRATRPELLILEAGRSGHASGLSQLNSSHLLDLRLRRVAESEIEELIKLLPQCRVLKHLEISLIEPLRESTADELIQSLRQCESLESWQLPNVKGNDEFWKTLARFRA